MESKSLLFSWRIYSLILCDSVDLIKDKASWKAPCFMSMHQATMVEYACVYGPGIGRGFKMFHIFFENNKSPRQKKGIFSFDSREYSLLIHL